MKHIQPTVIIVDIFQVTLSLLVVFLKTHEFDYTKKQHLVQVICNILC